jgi:hypothetical protein
MPLVRGHHEADQNYTVISNAFLRDKNLSLAAIGLLAQLLSHKEGWEIGQESLAKANNIGRDAMRTIIKELMQAGYLMRSEHRVRNEAGHLAGYVYTTRDPWAESTTSDCPTTGEPTLAEPTLGEPTQKNTITKNPINKKSSDEADEQFEEFWNAYPKAPGHRTERKADARLAFKAALKKASYQEILDGAIAYSNLQKENQYKLIAVKWLRNEGWTETHPAAKPISSFWNRESR